MNITPQEHKKHYAQGLAYPKKHYTLQIVYTYVYLTVRLSYPVLLSFFSFVRWPVSRDSQWFYFIHASIAGAIGKKAYGAFILTEHVFYVYKFVVVVFSVVESNSYITVSWFDCSTDYCWSS